MVGNALVYGVLLPALIAFVLLLLGGRGTSLADRSGVVLGALAVGAGYVVAHLWIAGSLRSPLSRDVVPQTDWIAWLVIGVIVLAPLRIPQRYARWTGPITTALFSVLLVKLVGGAAGEGTSGMLVRLAETFAVYVAWNLLERLALRSRGPALPVALVVAGSGIAVSALLVHIAVLAQLTGAVCAALGAAALLAILQKDVRLALGAIAVVTIVFAGVLLRCTTYDLPFAATVLLAAAVLAPWITEIGPLAGASATKRALVAAIASAVPAAVAVAIVNAAFGGGDA